MPLDSGRPRGDLWVDANVATVADLKARDLYSSIMEEVKVRAASINSMTNVKNGIPPPLIRESCYLQLRMMCELIALGCLVAHGDIDATHTKPFQKAYKADDILTKLEALHPNFYPLPRKPEFGPKSLHLADYDGGAVLTKSELRSLYTKAGDILHKGSLRRLLTPQNSIQIHYTDIIAWGQKILNLLHSHSISRFGNNFHFIVFLESAQVNGNVLVVIAERSQDE